MRLSRRFPPFFLRALRLLLDDDELEASELDELVDDDCSLFGAKSLAIWQRLKRVMDAQKSEEVVMRQHGDTSGR